MAQCVGFFHNPAGSGRLLKKSTVVGRIGSGRSVEIFNWVFPRYLIYSRVFQEFRYSGLPEMSGIPKTSGNTRYPMIFRNEPGQVGY